MPGFARLGFGGGKATPSKPKPSKLSGAGGRGQGGDLAAEEMVQLSCGASQQPHAPQEPAAKPPTDWYCMRMHMHVHIHAHVHEPAA